MVFKLASEERPGGDAMRVATTAAERAALQAAKEWALTPLVQFCARVAEAYSRVKPKAELTPRISTALLMDRLRGTSFPPSEVGKFEGLVLDVVRREGTLVEGFSSAIHRALQETLTPNKLI